MLVIRRASIFMLALRLFAARMCARMRRRFGVNRRRGPWLSRGGRRGGGGGVGGGLGGVEDDAAELGVGVVGGAEGGVVAVHGGDAAEEELGDVGDGHGVAAVDAFAGELADEVTEEEVARVRS